MIRTTRAGGAIAAAFALTLLAAACGDDDDDTSAGDTSSSSSTAPEGDVADAATVEVTAVDYAFEGLPATVEAGTQLSLTNASEAELHELVALRIPDDEDRSVEELAALPEEEVDAVFGEAPPAMVLIAPPGEDSMPVLGDGTISEPGRYAIVCFIPTGADPEEYMAAAQASGDEPPQVDGGPPHVVQGMHAELTVE